MFAWDSSAPFGVPVVPDVYISIAGSPAPTSSSRCGVAAGISIPSTSTIRISNVAPVRRWIASSRSRFAAVANTTLASECVSVYSSCASCASRLIGDTTKPPYIAPMNTVAALNPFSSMNDTVAPGEMPCPRSRPANAMQFARSVA